MQSQGRIKFLIFLATIILVGLFVFSIYQIVDLSKTRKQLTEQQEIIQQLEEEIDYLKNKQPDQDYETIT